MRYMLFTLLFTLPFLLTADAAPDLKTKQRLRGDQSLAEQSPGTYKASDVTVRRVRNNYAEFTGTGTSFWAKVPDKIEVPEGPLTVTVLKQGDFQEVSSIKSLNYEERAFIWAGTRAGQPVVSVEGRLRPISQRPDCRSGTAHINPDGDIGRLTCPSSSGSASVPSLD